MPVNNIDIDKLKSELLDKEEYDDLMHLFKMFADTTRLRIFSVLSKGSYSVNDLSEILEMSQSAVSHQLSNLRRLNLVKFEKVGLRSFYSLADDHVMTIFLQALEHIRE